MQRSIVSAVVMSTLLSGLHRTTPAAGVSIDTIANLPTSYRNTTCPAMLQSCAAHTDAQDGSAQRSQWHGWGDVSLLKHEGHEGEECRAS